MLQYLQSWFPGWGGWYGQHSPEGRPGEGLTAEWQAPWTPEEILGKAGAGRPLPFSAAVKGTLGSQFTAICETFQINK